VDKDLVKLEEAEGLSAFLRLQRVKKWSDHPPFHDEAVKNVDILIERVTKAVETHLGDPKYIKHWIDRLSAPTPEERGFAFVKLQRSGYRAVPYLVEALQVNYGKPLFPKVRETLSRNIGPEAMPVYLEMFKAGSDKDYNDVELRLTMLDLVYQRDDNRVMPYLWHLSASKKYPEAVRKKAKEVLGSMLKVHVNDLPPAREKLTEMAEQYYRHKAPLKEKEAAKLWKWDGKALSTTPKTYNREEAEEFYGLRYASEALDLDPGYQPAQVVYLSIMLDRAVRPGLDTFLTEAQPLPPKLHQLLTTLDFDLAMRVMERGMEDREPSVILPLVVALGERGDYRAARSTPGDPRGLVRGLYYPDRRVQFASMQAMLKMPPSTTPAPAADRMVELARRFVAADLKSKALVAYAPMAQEAEARKLVTDLGYEAVLARKTGEALTKAKETADFDLIVLIHGMPDSEFPFVYGQLRREFDLAGLPMIVVVSKDREKAVKKFVAKDRGVVVITTDQFKADDELKGLIEGEVRKMQLVKLTADERARFADVSMDTLKKMALGQYKGYDVTPALEAIKSQVRSPKHGLAAIEILGRMPGKAIQLQLAGLVNDATLDEKKVRMPALLELNRHMRKNGVQLDPRQLANLRATARETSPDSVLAQQFNVTLSLFAKTTAANTGKDLLKFGAEAGGGSKGPTSATLAGTWKADDGKGTIVVMAFDGKSKVTEWGVLQKDKVIGDDARQGRADYRIDNSKTPPVIVVSVKDAEGKVMTHEFKITSMDAKKLVMQGSMEGDQPFHFEKISANPRFYAEQEKKKAD
jgi:CheY-like chemotaxis protein